MVSLENTAHDLNVTENGKLIPRSLCMRFLCNTALNSIVVYVGECDLGWVQLHFNSDSTS